MRVQQGTRWLCAGAMALVACAQANGDGRSGLSDAGDGGDARGSAASDGGPAPEDGGRPDAGATDAADQPDAAPASDGGDASDGGSPQDLVQRLLAITGKCAVASNGKYSTDDDGKAATLNICKLNGAFFWRADMDIDCDGQQTTQCNKGTDPAYQPQTSFEQSDGKPLNAYALPYVVVPLQSTRFDYEAENIRPGALAIVIFNGELNYGAFGDEGPDNIIGEASYAMANSLGIDPDPSTGGVDTGVTYIVFTGAGAVVSPIENHQAAVNLGQTLVQQLLQNN